MIKETCNKCGSEVINDRKLDDKVWNCPSCGLEEYQFASNSTEDTNKESNTFHYTNSNKQQEDLSKHHLNKEKSVSLTLSEGKEGISRAFSLDNAEIIGIFSYAGGNKLIMKISKDCKLCCEFRLDNISFEVDFSNEIERVLEYRKERDVIEHLSELMIERFVIEANRNVIEFVEFSGNDSIVRTALLGYVNKGLVSFDIAEAVTEIEVSDEGLISFSTSDKPADANETSKYMTKEEIEKHNAKIDEQVKAMEGFLNELFS